MAAGDEDSDKEDSEEESAGRFSEAEALKFVLKHKESIQEVKALCGDLQVLGRSEFKQLLRWRMKIRKDLEAAEKTRANELKAVRPLLPFKIQSVCTAYHEIPVSAAFTLVTAEVQFTWIGGNSSFLFCLWV